MLFLDQSDPALGEVSDQVQKLIASIPAEIMVQFSTSVSPQDDKEIYKVSLGLRSLTNLKALALSGLYNKIFLYE